MFRWSRFRALLLCYNWTRSFAILRHSTWIGFHGSESFSSCKSQFTSALQFLPPAEQIHCERSTAFGISVRVPCPRRQIFSAICETNGSTCTSPQTHCSRVQYCKFSSLFPLDSVETSSQNKYAPPDSNLLSWFDQDQERNQRIISPRCRVCCSWTMPFFGFQRHANSGPSSHVGRNKYLCIHLWSLLKNTVSPSHYVDLDPR